MDVQYRDKWRSKASEVVAFIEDIGISIEDLLTEYEGKCFVDGVEKAPVFKAVLSSGLSEQQLQYLDNRCGKQYSHFRDSRSGAEYAADLIISWVQEDALLGVMTRAGLKVELDGTDKYRELLKPGEISATSDFVLTTRAVSRKLELAFDATGYWRKTGKFDLRDSKFDRLVNEKSILLGVAILTREAFVIDTKNMDGISIISIPHHPVYKKPAKTLLGVDKLLLPIENSVATLLG
jgi:hypothetical protein